jgi:hypothetical protein
MPKIKKGTKISDLAGSWDMTDEETEEIIASIRKMRRSSEEVSCF